MSEPTFLITLGDLRILADTISEADGLRPGDAKYIKRIVDGHAAIIRTMGNQTGLIYDCSEEGAVGIQA